MHRYLDRTQRTGWHRCGARRNLPLPAYVVPWRGPNRTEASCPSFPPSGCRAKSPTPPRTRSAQVTVWALVSPPRAAWQWRPMFPRLASPRLRHDADVGLRSRPALRVDLLGLFVRHRASDDHILTLFPIHGRRDPVLGRQLKRVDYPEHLVEVAPGGH